MRGVPGLDGVPRVDAMAERAVLGPSDDSDREVGDHPGDQSSSSRVRLVGRCGSGHHVQDPGSCHEVPSQVLERSVQIRNAGREWEDGTEVGDEDRRCRVWKLFVLVPSQGRWEDLLMQSRDSAVAAI